MYRKHTELGIRNLSLCHGNKPTCTHISTTQTHTFHLHKHIQSTHLYTISNIFTHFRRTFTHHTQPQHHAAPEQDIVQQRAAPHPLAALHHDDRHLKHHGEEAISSELARDAPHDKFVSERRDEEGNGRGDGARRVVLRGRVHVSSEEMVDGLVPLA
jgi:hypothetical protein